MQNSKSLKQSKTTRMLKDVLRRLDNLEACAMDSESIERSAIKTHQEAEQFIRYAKQIGLGTDFSDATPSKIAKACCDHLSVDHHGKPKHTLKILMENRGLLQRGKRVSGMDARPKGGTVAKIMDKMRQQ